MIGTWLRVGACGLIGWCAGAACSAPQQGGGPAPTYAAPPPPPSDPANTAPQPGGHVSVALRVTCANSVNVFFGSDPKFGSGRASRMSGNSVQNESLQAGDKVWLTDEQKNGLGSVTVAAGMSEISVACNGISAH